MQRGSGLFCWLWQAAAPPSDPSLVCELPHQPHLLSIHANISLLFFLHLSPRSPLPGPQFGFYLRSWSSRIFWLQVLLLRTAAKSTKYKSLPEWWRRWREREGEREREHCRAGLLCGSINIALWPRSHENLLKDKDDREEKGSCITAPVRLWLSCESEI